MTIQVRAKAAPRDPMRNVDPTRDAECLGNALASDVVVRRPKTPGHDDEVMALAILCAFVEACRANMAAKESPSRRLPRCRPEPTLG